MTASVNKQGHIVLGMISRERLGLKPGDVLVVCRGASGSILLRKRKMKRAASDRKAYLTPPPLRPQILEDIYAKSDSNWTSVEREAVEISRRGLAGENLEEL